MTNKSNENKDWENLSSKNKSFLVSVLHWYHFRKNRLHRSWKREEVITWELIRAFDILPREYFLKEFLLLVLKKNSKVSEVIKRLLANLDKIKIEPYPLLGLHKNRKNSRSDIGFVLDDSCLWLEIKTALDKKLTEQIKKQKSSPNFRKYRFRAIVALVPKHQNLKSEKIYWQNVAELLQNTAQNIDIKLKEFPIWRGYSIVAHELINRIESENTFQDKA